MRTAKDPWLRPFEFQLIQRLYLKFGTWSGGELLDDLERWVKNDIRQEWWVRWFEHQEPRIYLRYYLNRLAGSFLWSVSDVWDARRNAKETGSKFMLEMQERLGPQRLVWEHGFGSDSGYYSANHSSPRLRETFDFRFTGQRAGSEWHRDIVTQYATILQSKGRFVTVDTGAVESKLPDIALWTPHSPLEWWPGGAIEVELEAYKKSDEAIMRNLEKHLDNHECVRFVVMSEKSFERISSLVKQKTGIIASRVENYLGYLNNPIQIEVIDSPTGQPYMDFLRSEKIPELEEVRKRSGYWYQRIMTARELEKEKRDREEARMPEKWQRAWEQAEQGNDNMLTGLRRTEYQRKVAEEDRRWFEAQAKKGGRVRVKPRRRWPRPDT